MGSTQSNDSGPGLTKGISVESVPEGQMLVGHVGEDRVLLARRLSRDYQAIIAYAVYSQVLKGA
jgi:hypothetical protein